MTERRLLATLAVIALVVSSVAAVGVGVAEDSADGDVRVNQQADGSLLIEFDNGTFPDRLGVGVSVTANNETIELDTNETETEGSSWWGREVPVDALPDSSLADARVRVTYNGTEEFNRTMDLRYLGVDSGSASFDSDGRLTMNATAAGLGADSVDVEVSALGGEPVTATGTISENGVLRLERGPLGPLLRPPATVTLSAADSELQFVTQGSIDLGEIAETDVSLRSGGVVVSSPLLVDGSAYHVTLTTDDPAAAYVSTVNASSQQIQLANEYVAGAGDVTVEFDGQTVLNGSFEPAGTLSGSIENGTVTIADGTLPDGSVDRAVLNGSSGVRVLDNVTQQSGTVTLPGNDSGGVNTLVLLYSDGSSVFVDIAGGASASQSTEGTATPEPTEGGLIPSTGGNNVLVGAILTLAVLLGLVLLILWRTSSDDGATGGGASGPRKLTVSVIDGYSDSRITDPVTVQVTPRQQRTKEGYQVDTSSETHEITDGESRIEVPRKPVEIETTYNGISTSRTVELADSGPVRLTLGPVSRTLTVRDDDGEPIPGVTVAVVSGGQTHLTRETDEGGRAQFDVSADATDFDIVVEHDRFESVSRHVADPSVFPDSISLVEKTGTLRVRTGIDGEPTDAVDLRIRAAEGTRSEAAPTVEQSTDPGIYEFEDVQVGSYELLATADGSPFDPDRETVEIGADESVTADLDVEFRFSIDSYRDDIEALRTAADELVPSSQIDTAVHSYYASVGHALVDVVESLPDRGDQFAGTGVDPDAVAAALLAAGQGVVTVVDNALNTKQNVDLFNACADLPAAAAEWDEFEVATLFDLAGQERLDQQTEIRQRLSEVDERVDAEREELNIVSPASDVLDELRDYARSTQKPDATRNAAVAFVVIGFADAVDGLFDRGELRERLQYTRF
jgi:hypothetical protein